MANQLKMAEQNAIIRLAEHGLCIRRIAREMCVHCKPRLYDGRVPPGLSIDVGPVEDVRAARPLGAAPRRRDPNLRWMDSHVSVATDPAGNIKPVKPDRNRVSKRIDGIVAAIMAVGRESLRWQARSVYETRGMLTI